MRIFVILLVLMISPTLFSETITIEMLNKGENRSMIFSQEVVKINVGDTIFWQATDKGHNVEFIKKGGVPDGVEKFKSKVSKDAEYTFTIPGIYAYWCTPHKSMGMIGFVVVGDDLSNIELIKKVKFAGKSKKIAETLIAEIEGWLKNIVQIKKNKLLIFFIANFIFLTIIFVSIILSYNFFINKNVSENDFVKQQIIITPDAISPQILDRKIKIKLLAKIEHDLNWEFNPIDNEIDVKIGENNIIKYYG